MLRTTIATLLLCAAAAHAQPYGANDVPADQAEQSRAATDTQRAQQDASRQRARPAAPAQIVNCDPAGCWDTSGRRYNRAAGGTFFQDGKACRTVGATVECH